MADGTFHTVDEAARILKITPYQLRQWIHLGKIPAYKSGRRWIIWRSDLREYLDAMPSVTPGMKAAAKQKQAAHRAAMRNARQVAKEADDAVSC